MFLLNVTINKALTLLQSTHLLSSALTPNSSLHSPHSTPIIYNDNIARRTRGDNTFTITHTLSIAVIVWQYSITSCIIADVTKLITATVSRRTLIECNRISVSICICPVSFLEMSNTTYQRWSWLLPLLLVTGGQFVVHNQSTHQAHYYTDNPTHLRCSWECAQEDTSYSLSLFVFLLNSTV